MIKRKASEIPVPFSLVGNPTSDQFSLTGGVKCVSVQRQEERMKRALYIGKFQPFHIGHLEIVKNMDRAPDIDEIVIAVGSSQWSWQNRDPERFWLDNMFTIDERVSIIESSLRGRIKKKFYIVPIFDFLPKWDKNTTSKWFNGIRTRCPEFHVLYSNRRKAIKLFSEAGCEARPNPLKYEFSATIVREKMALGDTWQYLVAPEAARIIEGLDGEKRAAELFAKVDIHPEDYPGLAWEWRTFERISQQDLKRILALPVFRDEEICDQYLFSLLRTSVNFKLRKGGFKIKKLMARLDSGLEAWASFAADFPAERDWFLGGCKDIKLPVPQDLPEMVTKGDLLAKVQAGPNPYLFPLSISKKRFMRLFEEAGIRCGVDASVFNMKGREVVTVGLEAEDKKDVEAVLKMLGLEKYPAMNYMQFLERFVCKEAGDDVWKRL